MGTVSSRNAGRMLEAVYLRRTTDIDSLSCGSPDVIVGFRTTVGQDDARRELI